MSSDANDCHLCHLHDHNHPSTLLRTSTLRDRSPPPPRRHRHHHPHHSHSHSRSRSGSIDNVYRDHHHHHHPHHHRHGHGHSYHDRQHKLSKLPSALARLSEHSVAQSLPASRSNTLRLYPEQVSVLPDGGRRYIGGDRASVHSLELTSPMHGVDSRSHQSLIQTSTLQKPTVTMNPDMLTASLPQLRSHGSQLSLTGHNTLPPPQATPADYFMNRIPFKDENRKSRFNLQTMILIGCYTLLFVMAIIIGIVLSYQNGWLGFRSQDALGQEGSNLGTPPSVLDVEGTKNNNLNGLDRIQDGTNGNNDDKVPVHNVVQVRTPNNPRTNFAGILTGEGRPRSISGTDANNVRNIPGKRPIPNSQDVVLPHQTGGTINVQHGQNTQGTLNNQNGQILSIPQNPAGNVPSNINLNQQQNMRNNANQQINGRPNLPSNPQNTRSFGVNNQPHNVRNPQQNVPGLPSPTLVNPTPDMPVPFLLPTGNRNPQPQQPNIRGNVPGNAITTNTGRIIINAPPQQVPRNPFTVFPSNIPNQNRPQGFPRPNIRPTQQVNPTRRINSHSVGNQFPPLNPAVQPIGSNGRDGNFPTSLLSNNPSQTKPREGESQFNQIHMEKMKMLKEILDSEGSGKLLQDLLALKNNRNSITTISQHLSDVTSHGPNPAVTSSAPANNHPTSATKVLKPATDANSGKKIEPTVQVVQFPPPLPTRTTSLKTTPVPITTKAPEPSTTPSNNKPKSNVQVVRELLSSLINSPEVQEILTTRNKQKAEIQKTGEGKEVVKVQGDEMRELLLNALAKEVPNDQALQRLRLHGPQPSQIRPTAPRNRISARRGQQANKRGNITKAQTLFQFNTTTPSRVPSRSRGTIPARVLQQRIGQTSASNNKNEGSIEHQSVRPPVPRRPTNPRRRPNFGRTSRGRTQQKPAPDFRLRVKTEDSSAAASGRDGRALVLGKESVDMSKGDGEVVRHWRHMDTDGTVSLGTVRRDGSFAFTNCRPVEMCANKDS